MTIKNRLAKLEAQRVIPPEPGQSAYTPEQWQRSIDTLGAALGEILGIDPADVAGILPGVLAGLGGDK